jgi:uncharacterized protein YdeI (YjbR/CyaY-like superfamily)
MAKPNNPISFRAVLERVGTGPYWVAVRIPGDLKKSWPDWKSRRVRGTINDFAFRTSLFPSAKGQAHMLVVNKRMQTGARATAGETVRIQIEPDLEKQAFSEPKELTLVLKQDRQLRKWFDSMSPSMRKGFAQIVDQAKGAETRKARAERVAETVMQAMEGEQVTPPILRAAFARQPLAQQGWEAMTPIQRRNHLLGIFFPGTVEGQAKRAAKAVDECVRVARKKSGIAEDRASAWGSQMMDE